MMTEFLSHSKPSRTDDHMNIGTIPEGISLKIMSEELFQAQLSNRRTEIKNFSLFLIANYPQEKVNLSKLSKNSPCP